MTIERIAAAIKPILDEDRRADRERIAELERDAAHLRKLNLEIVDTYNRELDELTEKCAALVVENKRLREDDDDEPPAMVDLTEMARVLDECCVQKPGRYDNSTLRIDTDMSDPQPGKLLVVRLDADDMGRAWTPLGEWSDRGRETQNFWPEQRVGFLVETPAVKVKVDGWVVYDPSDAAGQPFRFAYGWQESSHSTNSEPFKSFEAAHEWMAFVGGRGYVAIPLAAAHAIEAATKEDAR